MRLTRSAARCSGARLVSRYAGFWSSCAAKTPAPQASRAAATARLARFFTWFSQGRAKWVLRMSATKNWMPAARQPTYRPRGVLSRATRGLHPRKNRFTRNPGSAVARRPGRLHVINVRGGRGHSPAERDETADDRPAEEQVKHRNNRAFGQVPAARDK